MNDTKFTVTVLGFNQALASAITGALDVFAFAGISWQRIHNLPTNPQFKVQLASHHGPEAYEIKFVGIPQTLTPLFDPIIWWLFNDGHLFDEVCCTVNVFHYP